MYSKGSMQRNWHFKRTKQGNLPFKGTIQGNWHFKATTIQVNLVLRQLEIRQYKEICTS